MAEARITHDNGPRALKGNQHALCTEGDEGSVDRRTVRSRVRRELSLFPPDDTRRVRSHGHKVLDSWGRTTTGF